MRGELGELKVGDLGVYETVEGGGVDAFLVVVLAVVVVGEGLLGGFELFELGLFLPGRGSGVFDLLAFLLVGLVDLAGFCVLGDI